MSHDLVELIRAGSMTMQPVPTAVDPRVRPLDGIRAVLFDVYGTLFTSGSGDVGTAAAMGRGDAFVEALGDCGIVYDGLGDEGVELLITTIREHQRTHETARYPEVDIVAVWRTLLAELGHVANDDDALLQRLAIEYEVRVNPVWPMPAAGDTLAAIRSRNLALGIVSNAQFFTPLLFEALLDSSVPDLGFDPAFTVYSFAHLQAKPGTFLYEHAAAALAEQGIAPGEVLYVGNDMLNDVTPARAVGFRTALFAGDARSLRWREGDARVDGVEPDVVVTELTQILDCLG